MMQNNIDPLDIIDEILGGHGVKQFSNIKINLSKYAVTYENGQEVASEAFSAYYSGVENEFATKFVEDVLRRLE